MDARQPQQQERHKRTGKTLQQAHGASDRLAQGRLRLPLEVGQHKGGQLLRGQHVVQGGAAGWQMSKALREGLHGWAAGCSS